MKSQNLEHSKVSSTYHGHLCRNLVVVTKHRVHVALQSLLMQEQTATIDTSNKLLIRNSLSVVTAIFQANLG